MLFLVWHNFCFFNFDEFENKIYFHRLQIIFTNKFIYIFHIIFTSFAFWNNTLFHFGVDIWERTSLKIF